MTGRILRSLSGFYDVLTPEGLVTCRGRGHLRRGTQVPLTGDNVLISGVIYTGRDAEGAPPTFCSSFCALRRSLTV